MSQNDIKDLLIVGSGMGGSLIAALNQDKNTVLIEKEINLGGCASTFQHNGSKYNTGATTLVGYEANHPLKRIFDKVNFQPELIKSNVAFRTIQNGKVLDRVKDFEAFLAQLDEVYYHKNNRQFWETVKEVDELFWQLKCVYYAKHHFKAYCKSIRFVMELYQTYKQLLYKKADEFIAEVLPGISKEYQAFIDAQLLITVQSDSKNIPFLTMALGISYPFHDVFYSKHGMGNIFNQLLSKVDVQKNEEVVRILKEKKGYRVLSNKGEYRTKNIIINTMVSDAYKLFEEYDKYKYYAPFQSHEKSAFVVYLKLDSNEEFLHHYQIILNKTIPNISSHSMFVSFSDINDEIMSKNGYSITISMHTKTSFWSGISRSHYELQKHMTQFYIIKEFLANFKTIKAENIKTFFSATSKTFNNYINRMNCGGSVLRHDNCFQLPTCTTPFKGIYNIGDTIFAGQGWPGVALGVEVLQQELDKV